MIGMGPCSVALDLFSRLPSAEDDASWARLDRFCKRLTMFPFRFPSVLCIPMVDKANTLYNLGQMAPENATGAIYQYGSVTYSGSPPVLGDFSSTNYLGVPTFSLGSFVLEGAFFAYVHSFGTTDSAIYMGSTGASGASDARPTYIHIGNHAAGDSVQYAFNNYNTDVVAVTGTGPGLVMIEKKSGGQAYVSCPDVLKANVPASYSYAKFGSTHIGGSRVFETGANLRPFDGGGTITAFGAIDMSSYDVGVTDAIKIMVDEYLIDMGYTLSY
jgi:hypothetical protein